MDANAINLALLALRGVAGGVMFAHGWNHLARMREGPGVSNWFASLGLHPAPVHAWVVTVVELVAGVSLVFGFLTPLGAAEQQRQRRRRGDEHAAPRHNVGHTGKLPRAFEGLGKGWARPIREMPQPQIG